MTDTVDAAKVWMCMWCGRKSRSGSSKTIRHMRNCSVKQYGDTGHGEVKAFSASVFAKKVERCSKCGHRLSSVPGEQKQ